MFEIHAAEIPTFDDTGVATIGGFETLFSNVVGLAVGFAGLALFIMLLIGGFNFLTAGTDAGKAQGAQKTITYAILGLVFIVASYFILQLIGNFTGVTGILNFTVVQP
ncbi:MAG: hypothetical protein AAB546_00490 [Patescibacteria group bacterium]